jgi:ribosome maturation factor RimP
MEERILEIIQDPMIDMGFNIVRLRFSGSGERKILEVLLEKLDDTRITVEECAKANRHIGALLDVEDIIQSKYNLEVSSAGIERPLVYKNDFEKYKDRIVQLKLKCAHLEKKKFQGNLIGIDKEDIVSLKVGEEILKFELSNIKDAKLVLTDELFRQIMKKQKLGAKK